MGLEICVADGSEIEERVDLDDDNFIEDMDDYVEDQLYEYGEEDAGGAHIEEKVDAGCWKGESPQIEGTHLETKEDGANLAAFISEEEEEKRAEMLSRPPHGSEVFIGGIPKDASEDDLRELCEPIGEIFEIKFIKDKETGESKGFSFISFKSKDVAQKAIVELHSKEFRGKTLRCSLSETKNRLFIGNVPKNLTEEEFRKVINEVGPGAENIDLVKDLQIPNRNRGFAFVLYYNNACADYSRQKMSRANFKLDGSSPTVTWADPKSSHDSSTATSAQIKTLYVKNIPENTTPEQLKELFQQHGEITKVVIPPGKTGKRDFGFLHFAERSSALKALKDSEKYEIDGQVLEVVFARPQPDKRSDGAGLLVNNVPLPYGRFPCKLPYASLGASYGAVSGIAQPLIYGRGPLPAGMQMVPMVLPDGRIGYVLQQGRAQIPHPTPSHRRSDRSNTASTGYGRGGSSSDDALRGRRYRPY